MHRAERIKRALDVLRSIELAVAADAHSTLPHLRNAPAAEQDAYIRHRTDNAVRLYCSDEQASASASCAPI